jgi:outer membrane protein assembly factor BamB
MMKLIRHRWREKALEPYSNERSKHVPQNSAEALWKVPAKKHWNRYAIPTALAVCENRALVAEEKKLYVYDSENGTEIQVVELPAEVPEGGLSISNGRVVVCCIDGSILALQ